jgi:hypothetical protein
VEGFAFVEIDVDLDLELEPLPRPEELQELLALAERDCFVGASLRPHPTYRWRVNGEIQGSDPEGSDPSSAPYDGSR